MKPGNLLLTSLAVLLLLAQTAIPAPPAPATIYSPFVGKWTGTLTYRDYKSNAMETLPTRLEIKPDAEGKALIFRYVYNDGPGKTVESVDTIRIDPKAKKYTERSQNDTKASVYAMSGAEIFDRTQGGTLTLRGTGADNGKPSKIRNMITVTPTTLTYLHEACQPGDVFRFRSRYRFTRVGKP